MDEIYRHWDELITEAITEANVLHSLFENEQQEQPNTEPTNPQEVPDCYIEVERLPEAEVQKYAQTPTESSTQQTQQHDNEQITTVSDSSSFSSSTNHQKTHPQNSCNTCKKKFKTKYLLQVHVDAVHLRLQRHTCNVCSRTFAMTAAYKTHKCQLAIKSKAIPAQLASRPRCNTCQTTFMSRQNLRDHVKIIHLKQYPFSCKICNKKFSNRANGKRHINKLHEGAQFEPNIIREKLTTTIVDPEKSLAYHCSICDRSFLFNRLLQRHISAKHAALCSYACRFCDRKFISNDSRKMHMNICLQRERKTERLDQKASVPYHCEPCNRSFLANSNLQRHLKAMHSEQLLFGCQVCVKRFSTKNLRNSHMEMHHKRQANDAGSTQHSHDAKSNATTPGSNDVREGYKNISETCTVCNETFANPELYKTHVLECNRQQEKKSSLICSVCQKQFCSNYSARLHENVVHFNRYPISCKACKRSFSTTSNYKCHECPNKELAWNDFEQAASPESFPNSSNSEETQKPSEFYPYRCKVCSKKFSCVASIVKHVRLNHKAYGHPESKIVTLQPTEPQRITCDICNMFCKDTYTLKKHVDAVHLKLTPHSCKHCGKCFSTISNCNRHMYIMHEGTERTVEPKVVKQECRGSETAAATSQEMATDEAPVQPKRYNSVVHYCDKCKKSFGSRQSLQAHNRNAHHKIPANHCRVCDRMFHGIRTYRAHMRSCKETKNAAELKVIKTEPTDLQEATGCCCEKCGKRYGTQMLLQRHEYNAHLKPRPYSCNYCDMKFTMPQNCRRHIKRKHRKELKESQAALKQPPLTESPDYDLAKKYCTTCQKSFSTNHKLRLHVNTVHLKLYLFSCVLCQRKFGQRGHLKVHMEKIHKDHEPEQTLLVENKETAPETVEEQSESEESVPAYDCTNCNESFATQVNLGRHVISAHPELNQYSCNYCNVTFPKCSSLKGHVSRKHGKEIKDERNQRTFEQKYRISCKTCNKQFAAASNFNRHKCPEKKQVTEESKQATVPKYDLAKKYCRTCKKSFSSRQVLKVHINTVHLKLQAFRCEICHRKFGQRAHLKGHMKSIHKEEQPKQSLLVENREAELKIRESYVGKELETAEEQSESEESIPSSYNCEICNRSFGTRYLLDTHVNTAHLKLNETNHQCQKQNSSQPHCELHVETTHLDKPCNKKLAVAKIHKLRKCPQKVKHLEHKHEHANSQYNFAKKRCGPCKRTFSTKQSLRMHIDAIHLRLRPYSCTLCHRKFAQAGHLQLHMNRIHNDNKLDETSLAQTPKLALEYSEERWSGTEERESSAYNCRYCKKSFDAPRLLEAHINSVHSKKIPCGCKFCGQTLSNYANCKRHELQKHLQNGAEPNTVKQSRCYLCREAFWTKRELETHMTSVHLKERSLVCERCSKSYATQRSLRVHFMSVHLKSLTCSCHFCGLTYSSSSNRRKHMLEKHPEYMQPKSTEH